MAATTLSVSPVLLCHQLVEPLKMGQQADFIMFRHEYDFPYLLDEIRIGPIDPTVRWQIVHGGVSLVGDWTSPYAMCRKLSPWENQGGGIQNPDSEGYMSVLSWKLKHPMLVMPNEQITVKLRREPGPDNADPYVSDLKPFCVLQGRSLLSRFSPPRRKVVPFVMSARAVYEPIGTITPQQQEWITDDGALNNSNPEDVKLDRFGIFSWFRTDASAQVVSGPAAMPTPIPVSIRISDSEGGYIIRDPTDIYLLGNGDTRIWDVNGTLRKQQYWTVSGYSNLAPFVKYESPPTTFPFLNKQAVVDMALVGYRTIPYVNPLDMTGNFFQERQP